jgi:hypothetical protein
MKRRKKQTFLIREIASHHRQREREKTETQQHNSRVRDYNKKGGTQYHDVVVLIRFKFYRETYNFEN